MSMRRRWLSVVPALAALMLALAGCGGGGAGAGASQPQASYRLPGGTVRFPFPQAPGFHPSQPVGPGFDVVAAAAIDDVNLVFLHIVARQAKPTPAALLAGSYMPVHGRVLRRGTETHSGISMGVVTVADPVREARSRGRDYIFQAAGGAWRVECQSTPAHRAAVEQACRHLLDGITVTRARSPKRG